MASDVSLGSSSDDTLKLQSAASFRELKSVMLVLEAHHFIKFLSGSWHLSMSITLLQFPSFTATFCFADASSSFTFELLEKRLVFQLLSFMYEHVTAHYLLRKKKQKHLTDNFSNSWKQLLRIISCNVSHVFWQWHNCQNTCEKADGNR